MPCLFDANASFGKPATGGAEFPTLTDRLAHMDRLGIHRALVWNSESRQNNALVSNQRLLDEIARTPGAKGRLIPALTVSGLIPYEKDGMATLLRQMREGQTRALRFTMVFGRLTLCQTEPVIRAVQKLRPFIVMHNGDAGTEDLLEFTRIFPKVPVILSSIIWGQAIHVLDLMRRRKNILMETSWLHTWEALRVPVRHFGAERVIFGTGYKSHYGAAIAALARADISDAERLLIAHGNLDRLTGLKTTPALLPGSSSRKGPNSFWGRCLSGRPLGVDVVDAHAHLGPSAGYVLEYGDEARQIKEGLRTMDALGIRTMIASGMHALMSGPVEGNDRLEAIAGKHTGRFNGYVAFNPHYGKELVASFDRYFSGKFFVGFKVLAGYWNVKVTDKRFDPMWAYANRHRLPVLIHTWGGVHDSPAMLTDIVRRHPHASFLLGHSGGGDDGRAEAETLAAKYRNVYLEWCGTFCSTVLWEETLKKISPNQVVFGTDAMAHGIDWELGRLLSVDVPDSVIAPILGANMRRILEQRR